MNFFALYQPIADEWFLFDNTVFAAPRPVAHGGRGAETIADNAKLWKQIKEHAAP